MYGLIFKDNNTFVNYGLEHFINFFSLVVIGIAIIYFAKKHWNEKQQRLYITLLCAFAAITQIAKPIIRKFLGNYDPATDLPFHLCNIMPIVMTFVMWKKSRFWFGVFYFWILTGTFQSLVTTTLNQSLPHYEAVRYWTVHGFITIAALYGVFIYGYRLTWKDALNSLLGVNVLAFIVFFINKALKANYMFLNAKPETSTMFDLLGPWPWYILWMEFLALLLFGLLLLPFGIKKISK